MNPVDKAKTRILKQDRQFKKNVDFLTIYPEVSQSLYQAALDIQDILSIDRSKDLDLIGRVVVQDRTIIVDTKMEVVRFGIDEEIDNPNYAGYGRSQYGFAQYSKTKTDKVKHRAGDSSSRASTKTIRDNSGLSDEYFRHLLRSKVAKNNSSVTYDEIISAVKLIAPGIDIVEVIDNEDMTFSLKLYGKMSGTERFILNQKGIIPKPQGVKYAGYVEIFDLTRSGDTSKRFGDKSSQAAGYKGA